MPSFHSSFNDQVVASVGNLAILPLKTDFRGPAPKFTSDTLLVSTPLGSASGTQLEDIQDIVTEALDLFKANCFFKNFEFRGNADRTLVYLILYIGSCLTKLSTKPTVSKQEALKILMSHAGSSVILPGDPAFPMNAIFASPSNTNEQEQMRSYLIQLRQETTVRLIERVYTHSSDMPSKVNFIDKKRIT
jgi:actin related protein 2/3 complex, subunit 3